VPAGARSVNLDSEDDEDTDPRRAVWARQQQQQSPQRMQLSDDDEDDAAEGAKEKRLLPRAGHATLPPGVGSPPQGGNINGVHRDRPSMQPQTDALTTTTVIWHTHPGSDMSPLCDTSLPLSQASSGFEVFNLSLNVGNYGGNCIRIATPRDINTTPLKVMSTTPLKVARGREDSHEEATAGGGGGGGGGAATVTRPPAPAEPGGREAGGDSDGEGEGGSGGGEVLPQEPSAAVLSVGGALNENVILQRPIRLTQVHT
jgi:hypothetical protein